MRQSLLLAIHSFWSIDSASGLLCICPCIRTYTSQSQLVRLGGSPTTKDGSDVFLRQSRAVVCVDVRRLASSSNCLWMRKSLKFPRASHVLTNLPCQGHQSVHQCGFFLAGALARSCVVARLQVERLKPCAPLSGLCPSLQAQGVSMCYVYGPSGLLRED